MDGTLLECPNCYLLNKKQYLGRVLPNGDFLVLRFHHGTTLLKGLEGRPFEVNCGCGFIFSIQGTVVQRLNSVAQ